MARIVGRRTLWATVVLGCAAAALLAGAVGCAPSATTAGGASIAGSVSLLGAGTEGVTVIAYRDLGPADGFEEVARATSDSTGGFTLAGLSEGAYTLYASEGGYAGVYAGVATGSAPVSLWMTPAGSVTGTVAFEGGASPAGARVSVVGIPVSSVVGADGDYRLDGIPAGEGYAVVAAREGCTVALEEGVDVAPAQSCTPPVLTMGATNNHPPSINTMTASPFMVAPTLASSLLCRAVDIDGDTLSFAWSGGVGGTYNTTSGNSVKWTSSTTLGNVLLWCTVSDGFGGTAFGTVSILVAPINHPPLIATVAARPSTVAVGATSAITCRASDIEGHTLSYAWTATGGAFDSTTARDVVWTAPGTAGNHTLIVTVSDGKGGSTQGLVNVQVTQPNRAPSISAMTPANGTDYGPGDSTTCSVTASDLDSDTLAYKWTATGGSFSGSGSSVTWMAPQNSGTYTITCEVSDGKGGVGLESRTVTVSDTNVIIW